MDFTDPEYKNNSKIPKNKQPNIDLPPPSIPIKGEVDEEKIVDTEPKPSEPKKPESFKLYKKESSANDSLDRLEENQNNEYETFEFRADPKEYFKIWIVNVALTILTLGIYSAWAKVRTNRYLYASTYLHGSNFEYNADPKRILIGRLIVVGLYGGFYITSNILGLKTLSLILMGIFLIILPWLIRQAIRFRLKSASYRNIRFRYFGELKSFYKFFILSAIILAGPYFVLLGVVIFFGNYNSVIMVSGILMAIYMVIASFVIYPIIYKKYQELIINNSFFGIDKFEFNASNKSIMWIFFKVILWFIVASVLIGIGVSIINVGMLTPGNNSILKEYPYLMPYFILGLTTIVYILILGFMKGVSDGYISNFVRNHTTLEEAKLKGTIKPAKLGWISFTNILLLLLSLGLLYPWTKIRYLKHKIENTHFACDNYDKFVADATDDISTYGEEAMDFFDIDIGV